MEDTDHTGHLLRSLSKKEIFRLFETATIKFQTARAFDNKPIGVDGQCSPQTASIQGSRPIHHVKLKLNPKKSESLYSLRVLWIKLSRLFIYFILAVQSKSLKSF